VTEVYAAGEAPISGADGKAICRAVRSHGRVGPRVVEKLEELPEALSRIVREGDLVVTMGAGSIGACAAELPKTLAARQATTRATPQAKRVTPQATKRVTPQAKQGGQP
jgi:UDP-N-acetylmuramate--alanine ligase